MAGGSFDFRQVKKLQKQMEQLERDRDTFCEACAKELAARLLAKVIKRTPVSKSHPGHTGGTLRRGWTTQDTGSGSEGLRTRGVSQYVDTIRVHHFDDTYVIEVTNPTQYASYVEYGHRTANHKGWVPGKFMLTISEQQIQKAAPALLEKMLQDYLRRCLDA